MKCSRYITRYLGKYKSLGTVKLKNFVLFAATTFLPYFKPYTLSTFLRYKSSTRLSSPLQKRETNSSTHIFTFLKNNKFLARFAFLHTFILYLSP